MAFANIVPHRHLLSSQLCQCLSCNAEVAFSAKVQESSLRPPATKNEAPVLQATEEGCGFVTTSSTLQADYEHMVPGMIKHDFDLNPHFGPDPTGMDD